MEGSLVCFLAVSSFAVLVSSCHEVCFIGTEYDPQSGIPQRWFLPYSDSCNCNAIRPGGMGVPPSSYRTGGAPHYPEKLIVSEDLAEIQSFFGCRVCSSTYTLEPFQYKFPFPAFDSDGFVLDFAVRAKQAAKIAMSVDDTSAGNQYHLVLGQYSNTLTTIRRCQTCSLLYWVSSEGVVSEYELRRFWVRYDSGTFAVGRHRQAAYFEWTDPQPPATPVRYYGFGSWNLNQTWVYYQPCN